MNITSFSFSFLYSKPGSIPFVRTISKLYHRHLDSGYTRDSLPAYSFVSRARARRDTTRQGCFVVIPAHTGVTIVYCGTAVPSCSSQMSARWLSITSRNACEHNVNMSEGDWLLGVLVLRWIALRNGSPGNCSGLCSCSSDTEEEIQKTVLGTSHLQLQIVKREILHPVRKSTWYAQRKFHPMGNDVIWCLINKLCISQQLEYLGSDVILRLSLCLGVRAVIYFSRRATVGTHNYRRLSAELGDTIVLLLTRLTVCAVPLTP